MKCICALFIAFLASYHRTHSPKTALHDFHLTQGGPHNPVFRPATTPSFSADGARDADPRSGLAYYLGYYWVGGAYGSMGALLCSQFGHVFRSAPRLYSELSEKTPQNFARAVALGFGLSALLTLLFSVALFFRFGPNTGAFDGNALLSYDLVRQRVDPYRGGEADATYTVWALYSIFVVLELPLIFDTLKLHFFRLVFPSRNKNTLGQGKYALAGEIRSIYPTAHARPRDCRGPAPYYR